MWKYSVSQCSLFRRLYKTNPASSVFLEISRKMSYKKKIIDIFWKLRLPPLPLTMSPEPPLIIIRVDNYPHNTTVDFILVFVFSNHTRRTLLIRTNIKTIMILKKLFFSYVIFPWRVLCVADILSRDLSTKADEWRTTM